MKTLLILLLVSSSVNAGVYCQTDSFGYITCSGYGNDSGYQGIGTPDLFGNGYTYDSYSEPRDTDNTILIPPEGKMCMEMYGTLVCE
jgi:hypothetical protein